jgi:hypothetical protein
MKTKITDLPNLKDITFSESLALARNISGKSLKIISELI